MPVPAISSSISKYIVHLGSIQEPHLLEDPTFLEIATSRILKRVEMNLGTFPSCLYIIMITVFK